MTGTKLNPNPYVVKTGPFDFAVVDVRTGAIQSVSKNRVRAEATAKSLATLYRVAA